MMGNSTAFNKQFTSFQSPPGPPSRSLPSVASGKGDYYDYISLVLLKADSSLTKTDFGLDHGVHFIPRHRFGCFRASEGLHSHS